MNYDTIQTIGNVQVMHKLLFSLIDLAREVEIHAKEGWSISEEHQPRMIGFNFGLWMVKPVEDKVTSPQEVASTKISAKVERKPNGK